MNRLVAVLARALYDAKSPSAGHTPPTRHLRGGTSRRPHNLRLGLAVGVVRTVTARVELGDRPIYSIDLHLGRRSFWATWEA